MPIKYFEVCYNYIQISQPANFNSFSTESDAGEAWDFPRTTLPFEHHSERKTKLKDYFKFI